MSHATRQPTPRVGVRDIPRHLDAHPLAEHLPPLLGDRLNGLRASILAYGQQEPIVLLADDRDVGKLKILDGRHRYLVAGELGMEPQFALFDEIGFGGTPAEFVVMREQRRQMTRDQSACVAALQTQDLRRSASSSARSRAAMTAAYGVHDADIRRARELLTGDRDLFDAAFRGEPAPGESRPLTLSRGVSIMRRRRSAARTRAAAAAAAPLDPSLATLITGDARETLRALDAGETLRALDAGSARLIFSDIPYNIGVDYGDGASGDALADEAYLDYWAGTLDAAARVLADDGSLYLMGSTRYAAGLTEAVRSAGLHVRRLIVWHESFAQYEEGNWADSWRPIIYAVKDPAAYVWHPDAVRVASARQEVYADARAEASGRVPGSVWEFPRVVGTSADRVAAEDGGNANQLPVALVERIVLASSDPGDVVLDFCSGGGTTGVAALRHGRRYVGIDREPGSRDRAETRLRADAAGREASR